MTATAGEQPATGHRVRPIAAGDVPAVVALVHDLAAYERSPDDCTLTAPQLTAALFGEEPALFGHVAVDGSNLPVGFALWFLNFSTWRGTHGIYVEDLYVAPEVRGTGLGRALLAELARVCVRNGYARLEWWVLDWNASAREAYHALGATALTDWVPYRVDGEALVALSGSAPPALDARSPSDRRSP
jgi:GNAT superfamily N-acetyltransferase